MEVGGEGGFEVGFRGEVVGGTAGEEVVAAEAEPTASAGELVEAVAVEGEEGMGGVDWFGGGDGAALWPAAARGGGGNGRRGDAEAVADVEDELGVGEESAVRDALAEEERGGTADRAGAHPGDGVGGGVGGEASVEAAAGEGVGEDRLGSSSSSMMSR